MKKRYFVGVIIAAIGLGLSIVTTGAVRDAWAAPNQSGAPSTDPWSTGESQLISQQRTTAVDPACAGLQTTVTVSGVGEKSACITQTNAANGVRFGSYDGTQSIVSFAGETEFYRLDLSAPPYLTSYSSESDVLVMKYDHYPGAGLTVYPDMHKHLQKIVEGASIRYMLNEEPMFPLINSALKTWYMNGYALSNNGRYIAVELMGDGIGVIDTSTMLVKRISNSGYVYGMGANPTVNLAITDDGSTVIAVGVNAGFRAYHNDDSCGNYDMYDTLPVEQAPPQTECPSLTNKLLPLVPAGFITLYHPVFSDDEQQLSMYSIDHLSKVFFTIAANGTKSHVPYLALGDSFSSGEGETDDSYYLLGTNTTGEKCHVSSRSYPFLLGSWLGLAPTDVHSVACSGATMADIFGDDASYWGQSKRLGSGNANMNVIQKNAAQAEALKQFVPGRIHQATFVEEYQPRAMTIGIGGNDAGLFAKLQACVMPDTCEWTSMNGRAEVAKEIKRLFPKLVDTYTKLKQLSPASMIYAVNYPLPFDDAKCSEVIGSLFNRDERTLIVESVHYMNQVVAAAAKRAGVTLLNVENSFGMEALCGEDGAAMNGIRLGDDTAPVAFLKQFFELGNETFHPTPYGHSLMAATIEKEYGDIMDGGCTLFNCPGDLSVSAPDPTITYWPSTEHIENAPTAQMGEFLKSDTITKPQNELKVEQANEGFAPNTRVQLTIHSDSYDAGSITTDDSGHVSTTIALPADLAPGYHTVHLTGSSPSGEELDVYQTFLYQPTVTTAPPADGSLTGGGDPSPSKGDSGATISLPLTPFAPPSGSVTAGASHAATSSPDLLSGSPTGVTTIPATIEHDVSRVVPLVKDAAVKGVRTIQHVAGKVPWLMVGACLAAFVGLLIILLRKRDHRRH